MKLNVNFRKRMRIPLSMALLMLLSACQSIWDASPEFGSTINGAIQDQLVNPNAPVGNKKVTTGLDGGAAKGAVDSYQKSFEVRVPTSSGTYPAGAAMGTSSGAR
jgi:hypothetical protein